jgi:hypothetical protein
LWWSRCRNVHRSIVAHTTESLIRLWLPSDLGDHWGAVREPRYGEAFPVAARPGRPPAATRVPQSAQAPALAVADAVVVAVVVAPSRAA